MGLLMGALGGLGKGMAEVGTMKLKEEAEMRRQANLERISNSQYDRSRTDSKTDAASARELALIDEKRKLGQDRDNYLFEQKNKRYAPDSSNIKHTTVDIFDPNTGTKIGQKVIDANGSVIFDGSSPSGPVMSFEEALNMAKGEAESKAGWLSTDTQDFGGSKEEWVNNRAISLMNSSNKTSVGDRAGGGKIKSSFNTSSENTQAPDSPVKIEEPVRQPVRRSSADLNIGDRTTPFEQIGDGILNRADMVTLNNIENSILGKPSGGRSARTRMNDAEIRSKIIELDQRIDQLSPEAKAKLEQLKLILVES